MIDLVVIPKPHRGYWKRGKKKKKKKTYLVSLPPEGRNRKIATSIRRESVSICKGESEGKGNFYHGILPRQ